MQVQIVLWRELPPAVKPVLNKESYWLPNPAGYLWRWLVVDANSDQRLAFGGPLPSRNLARGAAMLFALNHNLRVVSRTPALEK